MLRNAGNTVFTNTVFANTVFANTVFAKSDFLNGDGNESGNLRKNKEILRDALRNVYPLGPLCNSRKGRMGDVQ